MSTAGKVLTVLVLLVMLGWIVLLSGVAQLDTAWGEKISKQEDDLAKLAKDFEKTDLSIRALTEQARVQQEETDRDLRVLEARIAAARRRQSSTTEDLTRLKQEVADYLAAAEKANANRDARKTEKAQRTGELSAKRDEIAKLKALNAERRAELAQLEDEFKRLLAENAANAQKAAEKKSGPGSGTPARPASNRREAPAS